LFYRGDIANIGECSKRGVLVLSKLSPSNSKSKTKVFKANNNLCDFCDGTMMSSLYALLMDGHIWTQKGRKSERHQWIESDSDAKEKTYIEAQYI
jgi:hypothetical protein